MCSEQSNVYQRWDDGFLIRRMRQDEEVQVRNWWSEAGPVPADLEIALDMRGDDAATHGFYVGELNGEMVASLSETRIADDLGYIGHIYVVEQFRKAGFAGRMITLAHSVRQADGDGILALDAPIYLESLYNKFGYKTAFEETLYLGTVSSGENRDDHGTNITEVSINLDSS